jgi:hypothetical protein
MCWGGAQKSQAFGSFGRILSHHVFEFVYILLYNIWENFLDDYHGKLGWGVPYMPNASGLYVSTLMKLVCNSHNCLKPECQQSMKCKVHPV